ncbi:MAG: hypothetical protein Hens3KO_01440 [Henriciella sp.]
MATRVVFQLVLFLLPFFLFGIYRIAIAEAKQDGRKPWPIKWLFGIGLVLAVGSWLAFIFLDRGGRDECYRPARMENGVMIPGETYVCDRDLTQIGVPPTDDPGGVATGVGEANPAGPDDIASDEE